MYCVYTRYMTRLCEIVCVEGGVGVVRVWKDGIRVLKREPTLWKWWEKARTGHTIVDYDEWNCDLRGIT